MGVVLCVYAQPYLMQGLLIPSYAKDTYTYLSRSPPRSSLTPRAEGERQSNVFTSRSTVVTREWPSVGSHEAGREAASTSKAQE